MNEFFDSQKYYLIKDNNVFKFIIAKNQNNILIKSKDYILNINNKDLSLLTKMNFTSINESYDFIINLFDYRKVIIDQIIVNESIKLLLDIKKKKIEIILVYDKNNNNSINKDYNKLINHINDLENEIKRLKQELTKLKDPKRIKNIFGIKEDSYAYFGLDNTFIIFQSIDGVFYLIFANKNKSIISFDITNNKKFTEIKKAHKEFITNFRHYFDKLNKRDLILSISGVDNNAKVWDLKIWNCIISIKGVNANGVIDSGCFLENNHEIFIILSNMNNNPANTEKIKVYNLQGEKVRELENSNDNIFFLDSYFDNKASRQYIITGCSKNVKTFNYESNNIYKVYSESTNHAHCSAIVYDKENIIKLIESSFQGVIRIWNFHSGELMNRIKVSNNKLFGICLNEKYLFVGSEDRTIKVIELSNGIIFHDINAHLKQVICLKIINLPKFGECLISQGLDDQIKIWKYKD